MSSTTTPFPPDAASSSWREAPGKQTVNRIIVLSGSNMSITPDDIAFLKEKVADYDLVVLQLEIPMEINDWWPPTPTRRACRSC